jgi:hypothetical protein
MGTSRSAVVASTRTSTGSRRFFSAGNVEFLDDLSTEPEMSGIHLKSEQFDTRRCFCRSALLGMYNSTFVSKNTLPVM